MAAFQTGSSSKREYFMHIHHEFHCCFVEAWALETSNVKFLMNKAAKLPQWKCACHLEGARAQIPSVTNRPAAQAWGCVPSYSPRGLVQSQILFVVLPDRRHDLVKLAATSQCGNAAEIHLERPQAVTRAGARRKRGRDTCTASGGSHVEPINTVSASQRS